MSSVPSLLDRPVYRFPEVDRLLGLRSGTSRRWIDGYDRGGTHYPPVVREQSTGSDVVTWGEFVETRLLSEYRNTGVPMLRMRPAVQILRRDFGRYPLARSKPFTDSRDLILKVQDESALDRRMRFVVVRTGQIFLSEEMVRHLDHVSFDDSDAPTVVHPLGNKAPVAIDPLVRGGEPTINGVPTEVLASLHRGGDSIADLARWYDLSETDVDAAIAYETTFAA
ncbi:MAG: DUF433 domain-containing protein [Microthrixaceae bacterium]|nr:DUF433 domain-containing protein [Microthrixaceae bacterium]